MEKNQKIKNEAKDYENIFRVVSCLFNNDPKTMKYFWIKHFKFLSTNLIYREIKYCQIILKSFHQSI